MNEGVALSQRIVRFGIFELDLWTGELRKKGYRIKLQNQPLQILTMLVEHPGELVAREDLQKRLWPPGTFVDVDHSLSTAINKLREALGDAADSPRFVETVGRRGYRFLASVEASPAQERSPKMNSSAEEARKDAKEVFQLLVESVKDYAIFLMDPEGNIKTWNPGAERIKGYQAEEIIGRHFSCFYTQEDLEHGKPQQVLKIAAEQGRYYSEGWRVRKDGSQFWAGVVITAVRDGTGRLIGFSKVTREITDRSEDADQTSAPPRRRIWPRVVGLSLTGLLAVAAVAVTWVARSRSEAPLMHFQLLLHPGLDPRIWPLADLAISPDGKRFVYRGDANAGAQLYMRAIDRLDATPVAGSEGGYSPFFSPDGQWIGFFAAGKLKKVPAGSDLAPVSLCNGVTGSGASWGAKGNIVFTDAITGNLLEVAAVGGAPRILIAPDRQKGEQAYRVPEILPGGKGVIFTAVSYSRGPEQDAILLYRFDTGERRELVRGSLAHYAATGHLVYARGDSLLALPFNPMQLQAKGEPIALIDGLMTLSGRAALFALSPSGTIAYATGGASMDHRELVWVDRQGRSQPLPAPLLPYEQPRLSPRGNRAAVTVRDAHVDVWLYDVDRKATARLTFDAGENEAPIWAPDGKHVTFAASRSGHRILVEKFLGKQDWEQPFLSGNQRWYASCWSPNGRVLALTGIDPITKGDIWMLTLEAPRAPKPFLRSPSNERGPVFSPDGLWLAYVSDESGRDEIYVRPSAAPGAKFEVSVEGGVEPMWARNGHELFYRDGEKMMVVPITLGIGFSAGTPRLLFEGPYELQPNGEANYDVAPDNSRFLMVRKVSQSAPVQVNVATGWFQELKLRAGEGSR